MQIREACNNCESCGTHGKIDCACDCHRAHSAPVNLDGCSRAELWGFWRRYHRGTRKDSETLIGDRRPGFTNLAAALANYACNKAVGMKCREEGDINGATCYEGIADRIYDELPADLKW